MNILGVRYGHDAAAALIIDGKIIADVAEERFTRIKNDTSFPIHAIQYCLEAGNIDSEELDCLAIPTNGIPQPFHVFFSIPESILPQRPKPRSPKKKKFKKRLKKQVKTLLEKYVGKPEPYTPLTIAPVLPLYQSPFKLSPKCTIHTVEHHLAHAASACYTSGLTDAKALIVTMDGIGDGVAVALWRFEHNRIECLQKYDGTSSLGWFYANATEAMQWRQSSDEWKLMGLAPYGTPQPGTLRGFYPEFQDGVLTRPHEYGDFGRWNDHGANHYHARDSVKLADFVKRLGREDFAAEVQRVSEEQAFNIILPWLEKENTRHLLCAGGFFLNVKFNQKLWYTGKLDTHWIYPNAGDSGIAVGAALHAYHSAKTEQKPVNLTNLYSGPEYSNAYIEELLRDRGLAYKYVENPSEAGAEYLTKNYVLGWFQGRMEAGPRALGNRSILMSPLRAENKDLINEKIKYRETVSPLCARLTG